MKEQDIKKLIDNVVMKAMNFSTAKYGDTPTDALQLTPKKYVDSLSGGYTGYVNSDGSAGNLPSGWSSANTGTGHYTITHNLGTANYSACFTSSATVAFPKLNAVNTNDVQPDFLDAAGNLTNAKFYFILIPF